jgi:hypothetical protein
MREATNASSLENKDGKDVTGKERRDGDESAKIHLNLDLEAEAELKANMVGDVTLGLT